MCSEIVFELIMNWVSNYLTPGYVATPVVLHPGDVKRANGIVHLPLYMTPFLPELDVGTHTET